MVDRLAGNHFAERRGSRRRAEVFAHALNLVEHLGEAVTRIDRLEAALDASDEPGGHALEGSLQRDVRGQRRRQRGVGKQRAVEHLGDLPEHALVDARLETKAIDRLAEQLGAGAVAGDGKRIGGDGDRISASTGGLDGDGERRTARALRVEADGDARGVAHLRDECAGLRRVERTGRIEQ